MEVPKPPATAMEKPPATRAGSLQGAPASKAAATTQQGAKAPATKDSSGKGNWRYGRGEEERAGSDRPLQVGLGNYGANLSIGASFPAKETRKNVHDRTLEESNSFTTHFGTSTKSGAEDHVTRPSGRARHGVTASTDGYWHQPAHTLEESNVNTPPKQSSGNATLKAVSNVHERLDQSETRRKSILEVSNTITTLNLVHIQHETGSGVTSLAGRTGYGVTPYQAETGRHATPTELMQRDDPWKGTSPQSIYEKIKAYNQSNSESKVTASSARARHGVTPSVVQQGDHVTLLGVTTPAGRARHGVTSHLTQTKQHVTQDLVTNVADHVTERTGRAGHGVTPSQALEPDHVTQPKSYAEKKRQQHATPKESDIATSEKSKSRTCKNRREAGSQSEGLATDIADEDPDPGDDTPKASDGDAHILS